jgi:hypothetical protein
MFCTLPYFEKALQEEQGTQIDKKVVYHIILYMYIPNYYLDIREALLVVKQDEVERVWE